MKQMALALILSAVVLTSCGGKEGASSPEDARTTLDEAAALLAQYPSTNVDITAEEVPENVNTLTKATGVGNMSPAFQGDVTVSAAGSTIDAAVISTGGKVWVKTSLAPRFTLLDPMSIGAPDPAKFFTEENGILSLIANASTVEFGDKARESQDVLQTITATIDGVSMARFLPGSDSSGAFETTFFLDNNQHLRMIYITGPFYAGQPDSSYRVVVSPGNAPVDIQAP